MSKHDRPRRKWTKKVVEAMWQQMQTTQHLRQKGKTTAWWALVAQALNERFSIGVSGTACATKAKEVHAAGRPYPWDSDVVDVAPAVVTTPHEPNSDTAVVDALVTLTSRIDRIEALLHDRLAPTPDIKPAPNQIWVSRTQRFETNNERCHMRVTQLTNTEVTLEEIANGRFVYTLPLRSLTDHFSHVGFAAPRNAPTAVAPAATPPSTVDKLVPPAQPTTNGRKDLASML